MIWSLTEVVWGTFDHMYLVMQMVMCHHVQGRKRKALGLVVVRGYCTLGLGLVKVRITLGIFLKHFSGVCL